MRRIAESLPALTLLAMLWCAPAALAQGTSYEVPGGAVVERDHTMLGGNVHIAGTMRGDLQMFGGTLRIDGLVDGNVFTFGTKIEIGPAGRVTGDLDAIGGGIDGLRPEAVGGELMVRTRDHSAQAIADAGLLGPLAGGRTPSLFSMALQLSLLIMWLVGAILLTIASGREIRATSIEIRKSPGHTFLLGLVAFTSFVLTALVFSYLIPFLVGIPLLLALGAFGIFVKIFGMVAVFHAIGAIVAAPRTREQLQKRRFLRGDLALAIAGLLILGLIRLVPVVGVILWMIASVFGIGAALGTKFGRRDPWFLAQGSNPFG